MKKKKKSKKPKEGTEDEFAAKIAALEIEGFVRDILDRAAQRARDQLEAQIGAREAALEAVADQTGCCFVFRDYGMLVMRRSEASEYRGAAIPSDTPTP